MFCAFEGLSKILRLYGEGEVHEPGDTAYDRLRHHFPDLPGERTIIGVSVVRIVDSCRFGVPRTDFTGPRDQLLTFAERKGPEKLPEYRTLKNSESIDGLPGLEPVRPARRRSERRSCPTNYSSGQRSLGMTRSP
jgi:hypothetical protein